MRGGCCGVRPFPWRQTPILRLRIRFRNCESDLVAFAIAVWRFSCRFRTIPGALVGTVRVGTVSQLRNAEGLDSQFRFVGESVRAGVTRCQEISCGDCETSVRQNTCHAIAKVRHLACPTMRQNRCRPTRRTQAAAGRVQQIVSANQTSEGLRGTIASEPSCFSGHIQGNHHRAANPCSVAAWPQTRQRHSISRGWTRTPPRS
jgi:hypothetical protein